VLPAGLHHKQGCIGEGGGEGVDRTIPGILNRELMQSALMGILLLVRQSRVWVKWAGEAVRAIT